MTQIPKWFTVLDLKLSSLLICTGCQHYLKIVLSTEHRMWASETNKEAPAKCLLSLRKSHSSRCTEDWIHHSLYPEEAAKSDVPSQSHEKLNEPTTSYGTALSQLLRRRCTLWWRSMHLFNPCIWGPPLYFSNGVKKIASLKHSVYSTWNPVFWNWSLV